MEERGGFEPPVRFPAQWFSRPSPSTSSATSPNIGNRNYSRTTGNILYTEMILAKAIHLKYCRKARTCSAFFRVLINGCGNYALKTPKPIQKSFCLIRSRTNSAENHISGTVSRGVPRSAGREGTKFFLQLKIKQLKTTPALLVAPPYAMARRENLWQFKLIHYLF